MLVNNARIGAVAPLLATDVEKVDRMIELNVTALTRLIYAAAPAFVKRGAGTIITSLDFLSRPLQRMSSASAIP